MDETQQILEFETKVGKYIIAGTFATIAAIAKALWWFTHDRIEEGHVLPGQCTKSTIMKMSHPDQSKIHKCSVPIYDDNGKIIGEKAPVFMDEKKEKEAFLKQLKKAGIHYAVLPDPQRKGRLFFMFPPAEEEKVKLIEAEFLKNTKAAAKAKEEFFKEESEKASKNEKEATTPEEKEKAKTEKEASEEGKRDAEKEAKEANDTKFNDVSTEEYGKEVINSATIDKDMVAKEAGIEPPKEVSAKEAFATHHFAERNHENKIYYFPEQKLQVVREDNREYNKWEAPVFNINGKELKAERNEYYIDRIWNNMDERLGMYFTILKPYNLKPETKCLEFDSVEHLNKYLNEIPKVLEKMNEAIKDEARESVAKGESPFSSPEAEKFVMDGLKNEAKRESFEHKDTAKFVTIYYMDTQLSKTTTPDGKDWLRLKTANGYYDIAVTGCIPGNETPEGYKSFIVPINNEAHNTSTDGIKKSIPIGIIAQAMTKAMRAATNAASDSIDINKHK